MTYEQIGNITVHNADCLEAMRAMPDKAFDLAIVDPPYGIGAAKHGVGKHTRQKISSGQMKSKEWDAAAPKDDYFCEVFRVSGLQIVMGGNYFPQLWGQACRGLIVWDKGAGMRGRDFCECEFGWTNIDTVSRVFYYDLLADGKERQSKIHPTQKPVALYSWLLTNYAKPGMKILDTHMGSGSIAIACHNLGFSLTAYELDQDYFKAAVERIKNHVSQGLLFKASPDIKPDDVAELFEA